MVKKFFLIILCNYCLMSPLMAATAFYCEDTNSKLILYIESNNVLIVDHQLGEDLIEVVMSSTMHNSSLSLRWENSKQDFELILRINESDIVSMDGSLQALTQQSSKISGRVSYRGETGQIICDFGQFNLD